MVAQLFPIVIGLESGSHFSIGCEQGTGEVCAWVGEWWKRKLKGPFILPLPIVTADDCCTATL
jgi:hypothetical protein